MMTLDEAIQHCQEKSCNNDECSMEHRQLAEWLTELKQYRENSFTYKLIGRNTIENLDMDDLAKKGIHFGDKVKFIIIKED